MEVRFRKQFLKDLTRIPNEDRIKIENLVFSEIPAANSNKIFQSISKMRGYQNYYKIRLGDFRIGLYIKDNVLEFQRVLHRKDIYRSFP